MAISKDINTIANILSCVRDDIYGEIQGLMDKYDPYKLKDLDEICSVDLKIEQYGNVNVIITMQDYPMMPLAFINELHQTYFQDAKCYIQSKSNNDINITHIVFKYI